jgi:hypothetical protein
MNATRRLALWATLFLLLAFGCARRAQWQYLTGPAVHDTTTVVDTLYIHRHCRR